ncbi:cysteine hydrolase family protein [Microvirga roseola]|uniref:cysteine hydrolase family protein n=1 Tax=Microvirga roseola TaxID=2883126 RepID=UPI001E45BA9E|nr:cysteine hydrolase family protein [Microvirga roseola]
MIHLPDNAALLVIDVQQAFDQPRWGQRNNPEAEGNIARLLAAWRASRRPVIHVHHESASPTGAFRRGEAGILTKPEAMPVEGERLYWKTVNSAFIGTSLEADTRKAGITALVIVGLTTNHCVSTTVRMAGNLGFDTYVVSDATATFERKGLDGRIRSAAEVHASALSDLHEEFATVVDTGTLLAELEPNSRTAA